MSRLLIIAIIGGTTVWATPTIAEDRTWSTTGSGPEVVATDCTDCGDDIGMMISCKGAGQPAEVLVHWAAMQRGVMGSAQPVTFQIAGETFSFNARTVHLGAIGYLPGFRLNPGDPLLAALQAGQQASVRFGSATTTIDLRGAQPAIETFKMSCGWSQAAVPQQGGVQAANIPVAGAQPPAGGHVSIHIRNMRATPVDYYQVDPAGQPQYLYTLKPGEEVDQPSLPDVRLVFGVSGQSVDGYTTNADPRQSFDVADAAARPSGTAPAVVAGAATATQTAALELKDADGATWSFSQGRGTATAIFGIPETDATSVAIVCRADGAPPTMEFFAAPTSNQGTTATVTLTSSGTAFARPSRANKQRRLEATLDGSATALKRAMMGAEWVAITAGGKPAGRFLGLASSSPGRSFLQACPQFAGG